MHVQWAACCLYASPSFVSVLFTSAAQCWGVVVFTPARMTGTLRAAQVALLLVVFAFEAEPILTTSSSFHPGKAGCCIMHAHRYQAFTMTPSPSILTPLHLFLLLLRHLVFTVPFAGTSSQ